MAVTPALIEAHRQAQNRIVDLAERALRTEFRAAARMGTAAATERLQGSMVSITGTLGEMSAAEAADFYDEARRAAGRTGRSPSAVAATAPAEQVRASTRWGVTPIWSETPDWDAALARLIGSVDRLVQQPGRETILRSAQREDIRHAISPQGGSTCDWCLMLASRGAVYHTEDTAGASTHDNCRCVVTPIWTDADIPQSIQDLYDEWQRVVGGSSDQQRVWREHIAATRN